VTGPLPFAGAGAGRIRDNVAEDSTPADLVFVAGLIEIDGTITLGPIRHVRAHPAATTATETPYRVVLEAGNGRELASARITTDLGGQPMHPVPFVVSLERVEGVARVVVKRGDEPLHATAVPPREPRVEIAELVLSEDRLLLRWQAKNPEGRALEYWVRFSADRGQEWQPLAVGLTAPEFESPTRRLAGGSACVLQVAAHDGYHSVYAETTPFELPFQPPIATILRPQDGEHVPSSRDVFLRGEGFSPQEGSLPREALCWASDRDGELGHGQRLFVDALSPGRHRVRLTVTDDRGVEDRAEIEIGVPAEEPSAQDVSPATKPCSHL
jgi:hypothetical protein